MRSLATTSFIPLGEVPFCLSVPGSFITTTAPPLSNLSLQGRDLTPYAMGWQVGVWHICILEAYSVSFMVAVHGWMLMNE